MPVDERVQGSAMLPEIYPWHDSQWATLTRDLARLPHALLLHGQAGIGKEAFALRLAQFLLCLHRTDNKQSCGKCRSCALFRAGNHPDFLRLSPLEDSKAILVDQVREVIDFFSLKAHTATHKIVVISPAQAMNVSAANSLLKVLEEPPSGGLLILVAAHISRLPATVRSRCIRVLFQTPSLPAAHAWLSTTLTESQESENLLVHTGGAPLAALALSKGAAVAQAPQLIADLAALARAKADPVTCAERWKSMGAQESLDQLYRFVTTVIHDAASSVSGGRVTKLPGIENKSFSISFIDLFHFLDSISMYRRQVGTGVDETLALEDLLIRWCEITARPV